MTYANICPEDRQVFEHELKTTRDAKWYRRLKIIDLSDQMYTVSQLSKQFDLSEVDYTELHQSLQY